MMGIWYKPCSSPADGPDHSMTNRLCLCLLPIQTIVVTVANGNFLPQIFIHIPILCKYNSYYHLTKFSACSCKTYLIFQSAVPKLSLTYMCDWTLKPTKTITSVPFRDSCSYPVSTSQMCYSYVYALSTVHLFWIKIYSKHTIISSRKETFPDLSGMCWSLKVDKKFNVTNYYIQ